MKGDPLYAKHIYDRVDMSTHFESKLVNKLGYRGPWILEEMLSEVLCAMTSNNNHSNNNNISISSQSNNTDTDNNNIESVNSSSSPAYSSDMTNLRILDIGCGSGLCGQVFEKYIRKVNNNVDSTIQAMINNNQQTSESENNKYDLSQLYLPQYNLSTNSTNNNNIDNTATNTTINNNLSTGIMVGVDVSSKMCEITDQTGHYDVVICGDFQDVLNIYSTKSILPSLCNDSNSSTDNDINDDNASNNDTNNNSNSNSNNNYYYNKEQLDEIKLSKVENKLTTVSPLQLLSYDIIIAADVFIYVGELGGVMHSVRHSLQTSSFKLFLFSVEDLDRSPLKISIDSVNEYTQSSNNNKSNSDNNNTNKVDINISDSKNNLNKSNDDRSITKTGSYTPSHAWEIQNNEIVGALPGWGGQLLSSARFAHSHSYIEALGDVYNYKIVSFKKVDCMRLETGIPLPGIFYIIQFL